MATDSIDLKDGMISSKGTKAVILVVDDKPNNLSILNEFLNAQGYEVRSALSGSSVWNSIQASIPDLILLDINMPGMDGFEACSRLKADPDTHDIPIIFLGALKDSPNKVKGLKAGTVDDIV